jgi:hypothetical protein
MVGGSLPDTARRYLMGHDNPDVGIVNYLPEGFGLPTLQALIEQDQPDLSMVKRVMAMPFQAEKTPYLVASDGIKLGRRL